MKIILLGLLAFIGWSAFSDYIYVCRIRGFCSEPISVPISVPISDKKQTVFYTPDSAKVAVINDPVLKPEKIIIYFEFDKSELMSVSETNKFFSESYGYLNQNSEAKLSITGFTDAIGSPEYNMALGNRRARSVQTYFESKGMPAARILIQSKGESEPADDNGSIAGRAKNRRTEITINN